jgi:A/G-specific adenine glycosylase
MYGFYRFLRQWYTAHGRHELPWRQTKDPYKILVSELMLQQTQVERVIPKYLAFIERFPTTQSLAAASLSEVLILWQGLGYNRRAKYALQCAKVIEKDQDGHFPTTESGLLELPGIGPYTASAICAFAYNQPVLLIETNVRTVYLYHFFPELFSVTDKEILTVLQKTLDTDHPREWYWALMDYGSYLKKILPNPSRRSKQHTKQSKFSGSLRQVRGEIIRLLTQNDYQTTAQLLLKLRSNKLYFAQALEQLRTEKLVVEDSGRIALAD